MPDSTPALPSNAAHAGLCAIVNDSVVPEGPEAVGANEYRLPTLAVNSGVPESFGSAVVELATVTPAVPILVGSAVDTAATVTTG